MAQSNHSNRCITYMVYHSIHVILLDLINRILMQRVQGFGEHIEGSLIPFIGESNTYNHSDSFITNASQIHRIITQFRGKDNAIMRAIMQVMLFLANPSGFGWFWLHFYINFYVRFTQIWTENRAKFELNSIFNSSLNSSLSLLFTHSRSINTSGTSIGPFDDEYVLSHKIWDPGGVVSAILE
eukprot:393384_1